MEFYTGVVEDRNDPLKLGRCKVRVVGLHTENKTVLPTEDLPWAVPMQPVTSASMNGIGWTPVGPVPGTWVIIFYRDQDEQQPVMMGTIGGIPQSKAAELVKDESEGAIVVTNGGILTDSSGEPVKDGSGNPIQVGTAESMKNPPPTAPSASEAPPVKQTDQPVPNKPSDDVLKQAIPTTPPPKSTSDPAKAEMHIKALIKACDSVGLTSKYAKCAILGICGGESGWQLLEEGYYYTKAESLKSIFGYTFPTVESAEPYVRWQGTREDFFRKIYSPQGNGRLVGHKDPDDGAKYFGRGFNQITGKALYKALQDWLKKNRNITVDFLNNPKSLVDDPDVAALATAAFYALYVKHDQNDPGYFMAALKRTGADANGTGYPKKKKYYEYFLGSAVTVESTNKPQADVQPTYTKDDVKDLPPAKQAALTEDRSDSVVLGFRDPSGKYPLRNLVDEPDTNRLARGVIKETAIESKDSIRSKGIAAANGADSWEQPLAPFGGVYPYVKVFESESGHLFILDDSPANEYVSLYHRTGSFIDIDANGTQVNKIIGDGYTIIDRNGAISIAGKANVTVGNGINIYVQGTADIQVDGAATINLNNNADIGVGGDLNLAVGGDINVQAGGAFNLSAGDKFAVQSGTEASIKSGAELFLGADGDMHLAASGNLNVDGAEFRGQEGAASSAPAVETNLQAPDFQSGREDQFPTPLLAPVRPSPPVSENYAIADENEALVEDYIANPSKYKNPAAAEGGVKENYAGTPKSDGAGQSLISGSNPSDLFQFLQKQLKLAETGFWRETGQKGAPSNPNITRIWADLGFKGKVWETDQTAWCMGFVNWSLKQCGYRYVQTGWARDIQDKTTKFGATQVPIAQAEPGDIVLWDYGHVNFVYTADKGRLTFVGGNQTPKAKTNNPDDGDVSISWPSGWTAAQGKIVGIWRPSKT